ncbi:hypothetical protein C8R44DRAFT_813683 [Mycena epipterygia]|nr:hypothetical protein C8R44DRAFT_813683 [Mycena epipterygia]
MSRPVSLIDLPPITHRTEPLHLLAAMPDPGIEYNGGQANTGPSNRVGGRGQRGQGGRGRGGGGRGTPAGPSRAEGGRGRGGEGRGAGRGRGAPIQTVSQAPDGRGWGTPAGGPSAIGRRGRGGAATGTGIDGNAVAESDTTPGSNSVPNGEDGGGGGGAQRGRGRKGRKRLRRGRGQNSTSPVQRQDNVEHWAPGEYAEFMAEFGWDVENMTIFDSD